MAKEKKVVVSFPKPALKETLYYFLLTGVGIAILIFAFFAIFNLTQLFIPSFVDHTYVSEKIPIYSIPNKFSISITVKEEREDKNFTLYPRVEKIEKVLERARKTKLTVIPSLTTYFDYKKNKTMYRLSYSITCELTNSSLDWKTLIENADSFSISISFDKEKMEEIEKMAEEKARKVLDEKADEIGKKKFFIYFGKKLIDESSNCGGYYVTTPRYYEGVLAAKAEAIPPEVGEKEVNCYVSANYILYGIRFGSLLFD